MQVIDHKKELKHLYKPSKTEVGVVEVPPMNYLMVDGSGDPGKSAEFQEAIEALYGVSYILKYAVMKSELAIDYSVMPLEGIWWTEDDGTFNREDKNRWKWTLMIMQPDYVNKKMFELSCEKLSQEKDIPGIGKLRFDSLFEGAAVQIMHIGLYSEIDHVIEKLEQYITRNGFIKNGKHHEIYLSDVRKATPDKWQTVLREPVKKIN